LKVVESEDESPDGDSNEDPTEKMAMLSNKLEYLARKNKKFLSKKLTSLSSLPFFWTMSTKLTSLNWLIRR